MDANGFTEEENKRLIVLFFKQIGLYNEFKVFMEDTTVYSHNKFRFNAYNNPMSVFGDTNITYYLESKMGYHISLNGKNLFDIFKAWLYVFYPNECDRVRECRGYISIPSQKVIDDWIDKDKRILKRKITKKNE